MNEKVTNEVNIINFLREKTTIPVPRITSWGLAQEGPGGLGPFIIMDFIDGMKLSAFLKTPTESDQDDEILNPEIDPTVLDNIYEQMADSFTSGNEYFQTLADEHILHFHTQRNLATTPEDARKRYIARHQFKQLIPKYCVREAGPFTPYCDDLQPSNMIIDLETFQITAALDFEFTNSMPAQFASDPPSWLLLLGPDMWLEDYSLKEFLVLYEPRLDQFLQAIEKVEA